MKDDNKGNSEFGGIVASSVNGFLYFLRAVSVGN